MFTFPSITLQSVHLSACEHNPNNLNWIKAGESRVSEVENSGRVSQEDKKGAIIESIIYSAWYIIIPAFQAPDKMLPGEGSERLQIYFDPSSTCYNENPSQHSNGN